MKKAWRKLIVGALAPIVLGVWGGRPGALAALTFDAPPGLPPPGRPMADVRFIPPDIRQFRVRDGSL